MAETKKKGGMRRSNFCKLLAILMFLLSMIGIIGGTILTAEFSEGALYTEGPDGISRQRMETLCWQDIMEVNDHYWHLKDNGYYTDEITESYRQQLYNNLMAEYDPEKRNFEFILSDPEETVILKSFTDSTYQYSWTEPFYETTYTTKQLRMTSEEWEYYIVPDGAEVSGFEEEWITETVPETTYEPVTEYEGFIADEYPVDYNETQEVLYYTITLNIPETELTHYITGYVRSDLTANDAYAKYETFLLLAYDYRYAPIIVLAVSVIAFFSSISFLLYAAGFRKDKEEASEGVFDKIPFDVFTASLAGAGILLIVFIDDAVNGLGGLLYLGLILACIVFAGLIALWWLMSLAVRIRTGTILKNNLLVIAAKKLAGLFTSCFKALQNLPILWQIPLIALGCFVIQIIAVVLLAAGSGFGLFLMILLYTTVIIAICMAISDMHLLEKGAEKIAGGDLSHEIPENKLHGPFKKHGRHLNSISEGMNLAVSERMKSEMFKTELIANVSHDIRTPLTSIINYTDLLSKLDLENAKAQEYIEVICRQSARLRKLTEDVLEASKATTGNMKVQKEKMDLRVLLEQIQGEFEEKLDLKSLQIVSTIPETPLYIQADGRLLWRVMDNLLGNICKYAMPGTRVYLDTFAKDGQVILTLRNISAVQLHISADALMERFVQGDRSRNTEGSGLGLSIAQSLTELQGGSMELSIDGDLFKVQLIFPETAF